MPRVIPVVLTIQDVKDLINAKGSLNAAIHALERATWAGAGGVIAALAQVDQLVIGQYNRCEPHWLRYLNRGQAPSLENGQVEIPPAAEPELAAPTHALEPGK